MNQERRHPNGVSVDEVKPQEMSQGDFAQKARRLGHAAGSRALGWPSVGYFDDEPLARK